APHAGRAKGTHERLDGRARVVAAGVEGGGPERGVAAAAQEEVAVHGSVRTRRGCRQERGVKGPRRPEGAQRLARGEQLRVRGESTRPVWAGGEQRAPGGCVEHV